jgi:hypothetical protein
MGFCGGLDEDFSYQIRALNTKTVLNQLKCTRSHNVNH